MSRHNFNRELREHIENVRNALRTVPADKRLSVIADAMYDLNPTGPDEVFRASCGCYEWDISIDYRNADVRYANKNKAEAD